MEKAGTKPAFLIVTGNSLLREPLVTGIKMFGDSIQSLLNAGEFRLGGIIPFDEFGGGTRGAIEHRSYGLPAAVCQQRSSQAA
jgi:hypothetical protein